MLNVKHLLENNRENPAYFDVVINLFNKLREREQQLPEDQYFTVAQEEQFAQALHFLADPDELDDDQINFIGDVYTNLAQNISDKEIQHMQANQVNNEDMDEEMDADVDMEEEDSDQDQGPRFD